MTVLLQHPETGEQTHASNATAERLIADEGWDKLQETQYADASEPEEETPPPPPADPGANGGGAGGKIPAPEKPLDDMKLTELIEHAEKIGIAGDDLAALKKAGMSKAKAKDAINAFMSAAQPSQ
jgi:hypothetical protein